MKQRVIAITMVFIGLNLLSVATAGPRDDILEAISKCGTVVDDKARLACYDALSPHVKDALATPPVSLDHEPTKQEQESWFGFDFSNLFGGGTTEATTPEQFGKERTPETIAKREEAQAKEGIDSITAEVSEVAYTPFGRFIVFLKNGQVWHQIEGDADRVRFNKSDTAVTISRGALGSYNLQIVGQNHIYKVTRVK